MILSTFFALVTALSSVVAVNGAIIQRGGNVTFQTPQPTSSFAVSSSVSSSSVSPVSSVPSSISSVPSISSIPSSVPSVISSVPSTFPSTFPTSNGSSASVPSPVTSESKTTVVTSPTTSQPSGASSTVGTPAPRASNCDGVQQWQSAYGYSAGDKAIFNNQLYVARQWSWNNAPPTHPDQWTGQGACTPPINNSVSCAGVSGWNRDTPYVAGNRVTFNGHLWTAVQWTQSNSPGDASGIWKDEGACT